MARLRALLGLLLLWCLATSCDQPVPFYAVVTPALGHVPYSARIVCTSLAGTYTYQLPDGTRVTSAANSLDVTVDRLDWTAQVTWSDGQQVTTQEVAAHGSNPPPLIERPRINGDSFLWYLKPEERTLIDFSHYQATLSGPETGVVYDGEWHVVTIQVEPQLKRLCGAPVGDSIFCPPFKKGEWHGFFHGQVYENACIVYPLYTSETAPDGRPYPPIPEEGYPSDVLRRIHDLYYGLAFPAQQVTIRVEVEDEWGRLTTASFEIPVEGSEAYGGYGPGHPSPPHPAPDYTTAVFYVSSTTSTIYHRPSSQEVCQISPAARVFFASQATALESGREPCVACFGRR
jgi:hypothetical protein